jgi:hypothetical protein
MRRCNRRNELAIQMHRASSPTMTELPGRGRGGHCEARAGDKNDGDRAQRRYAPRDDDAFLIGRQEAEGGDCKKGRDRLETDLWSNDRQSKHNNDCVNMLRQKQRGVALPRAPPARVGEIDCGRTGAEKRENGDRHPYRHESGG